MSDSKVAIRDGGVGTIHVLFADNDEKFIRAPARSLRRQGWQVTTATTLDDARVALEDGWFHVAILDLRMHNDEDNHDISGLLLAKEARFSPIPKIIYTTHVNGAQREAQVLAEPLLLVSKQDDRSKLIEAVRTALNRTPTNWNSEVIFNSASGLSFDRLAATISATRSQNSEIEVADLVKRLFHSELRRVTIERVVWTRDNRVAVQISTQAPVAGKEFFIVVFGPRKTIEEEVARFRAVGPKAHGGNSTYLSSWVITMHYGAIVYAIYTPESDKVIPLHAAYRTPREFDAAIKGLFETTLPPWHRDDSSVEEETVGALYRRSLFRGRATSNLVIIVGALARQSGRAKFQVRHERGRLYLPGGPSAGYSDPLSNVLSWTDGDEPAWKVNSPGYITGDNVLVDVNGRAWFTDFVVAGAAPVLANHVALEAMVHFDWVECSSLHELHEMEQRLTNPKEFLKVDMVAVSKECRVALQAIREIRVLASRMTNFDVGSYQIGMYYEAISRLAKCDPAETVMPNQLARLLHALISAAMIVSPASAAPTSGIELDIVNRTATVNGRAVLLTKLQFNILVCLDAKKPSLCSLEEIFHRAYNEPYRNQRSQDVKLHKAMNGLRDRIGEGWIENIRGSGFRLTV